MPSPTGIEFRDIYALQYTIVQGIMCGLVVLEFENPRVGGVIRFSAQTTIFLAQYFK